MSPIKGKTVAQSGNKGSLACAGDGASSVPPAIEAVGLYVLILKNPVRHDFATNLALFGSILENHQHALRPCFHHAVIDTVHAKRKMCQIRQIFKKVR